MDTSVSSNSSSDDLEEVEKDPTGRYVRYNEILGEGAYKIVYKAFDEDNGIEVAWNKVELSEEILKSEKQLERLYAEANLLKSLNHENVLRCYHSWVDNEKKTINMITELLTSGNLRQYRKKHSGLGVDNKKAIKNWARQILKGLVYLHSHNPPIIHRDLKCENLFVNGNSGKVKIGDLGLAIVLEHATACSVTGTPEFMAPELYEEEYNQLVDVYSFGMCMLQMVTGEKPYSECSNSAQVYKKVSSGIKPAVLSKVTDPQFRQFIEKCLAPVSERLSASELLEDPFLVYMTGDISNAKFCPITDSASSSKSLPASAVEVKQKVAVSEKSMFKLQGEMEEGKDSISMTLWIMDLGDHAEKADFVFVLEIDTNVSVAEEMVKDLGLSRNDASLIADLIEEVIAELLPADYYYKCCLAEAKGSSQISSSLFDEEHKSLQTQQLNASKIDILDKHDFGSQSENNDISTKEVSNSSVEHGHKSLPSLSLASQNHDLKRRQDEKNIRNSSREGCCKEVVRKARPNFLKRLFVHCRKLSL